MREYDIVLFFKVLLFLVEILRTEVFLGLFLLIVVLIGWLLRNFGLLLFRLFIKILIMV